MKYFGSVRLSLILVVLAGVLPVLAVIAYSGIERREDEAEHAKNTLLRLAKYYAYEQEQELDRIKTVLANLSRTPEVQAVDEQACNELFRSYLSANPNYANFAMMGPDGFAISSALPFKKPKDLSNRKEVADAIKTGRFSIGNYSVGRVSKKKILPVAYPVRGEQGQLICVLIAPLLLKGYEEIFKMAHLSPGSFVGLVDSNGNRLHRYPTQKEHVLGAPIAPNVWKNLLQIERQGMFLETGTTGTRYMFAVHRLGSGTYDQPYLNLFVGTPEKEILARADQVTKRYMAWGAISLFLSITLAYLIGKFAIHDRVKRLVAVAQQLGAGELSARSGLKDTSGALGKLSQAFDHMADTLEKDALERKRGKAAQEKAAFLEQANIKLQELDEIKSSLVSSVSHELRTPLTSIRGFAKLARKDFIQGFQQLAASPELKTKGERISQNLEIIEAEGERLTRLINDFLDINRIESGKAAWNDLLFDPCEIIHAAVASMSGAFTSKTSLMLTTNLPASAPKIHADPDKIQQVLINLLNNAFKFTSKGTVTVSLKAGIKDMVISVSDTGMGIPPAELPNIFMKFHKSHTGDTVDIGAHGTGLGLAISKEIVTHYGGNIWAESEEGKGSVFSFTLSIAS